MRPQCPEVRLHEQEDGLVLASDSLTIRQTLPELNRRAAQKLRFGDTHKTVFTFGAPSYGFVAVMAAAVMCREKFSDSQKCYCKSTFKLHSTCTDSESKDKNTGPFSPVHHTEDWLSEMLVQLAPVDWDGTSLMQDHTTLIPCNFVRAAKLASETFALAAS